MRRPILHALGAILTAALLGFSPHGGWAVVSVSKVPDAWIAGKPLQLSWQTRQHGREPLPNLRGRIEARKGREVVQGRVWAIADSDEPAYRGSITFPTPGEWQVTIHSGFGESRAVLLPWAVVDSVTPVRGTVEDHLASRGMRPLGEVEQGRRLFAAKGCVTCHVHRAVPIEGELRDFGPDLTGRRYPPEYLARFLANPGIKPSVNGRAMPNPRLREKDIGPIVAFINGARDTR